MTPRSVEALRPLLLPSHNSYSRGLSLIALTTNPVPPVEEPSHATVQVSPLSVDNHIPLSAVPAHMWAEFSHDARIAVMSWLTG